MVKLSGPDVSPALLETQFLMVAPDSIHHPVTLLSTSLLAPLLPSHLYQVEVHHLLPLATGHLLVLRLDCLLLWLLLSRRRCRLAPRPPLSDPHGHLDARRIMYFDTLRQPPRTALGATLAGAKASARSRTHTKGCLYAPLAKSRAR